MKKNIFKFLIIICSISYGQITKENISFSVNSILDIDDCIKWHVNYSELKNTVLYDEHLVSMGITGGIVAIHSDLSEIDIDLTSKLNKKLFTDLTVRKDTLFAEAFKKIYYFDKILSNWKTYDLNEPVKLFDIIHENEEYVFFPIGHGEFGSILFIYDKRLEVLRAVSTQYEAKAISEYDKKYYINLSLRHGMGASNYAFIKNIDKIKIVANGEDILDFFRNVPVREYPPLKKKPSKEKRVFSNIIDWEYGLIVFSSFQNTKNDQIQLYIDNRIPTVKSFEELDSLPDRNHTYLAKIENEKLVDIDSISLFHIARTSNRVDRKLFKGEFFESGYYQLVKDTLTFLNFKYKNDFRLIYGEENILFVDEKPEINVHKDSLVWLDDNFTEYEIKFAMSNENNVQFKTSNKNNEIFEMILTQRDNKYHLLFEGIVRRLEFGFFYRGNYFLYLSGYGLLEIYDLDKFIKLYTKI
jgi:hypothetical protein